MLLVADKRTQRLLPHWLGNARAAGVDYFLIAAADMATALHLGRLGLGDRCWSLFRDAVVAEGDAAGDYVWGGERWRAATWRKVAAAQQLLRDHGVQVLLSDLDVVWLADPLPFLAAHPRPNVMVSLDATSSANPPGADGLERDVRLRRQMNVGLLLLRPEPAVLRFVAAWRAANRPPANDQTAFNALLSAAASRDAAAQRVKFENKADPPLLFSSNDTEHTVALIGNETIRLAHLPPARFLNSYTHSVARLHEALHVTPIAVHMVWGYGDLASKIVKMRDMGRAYDPPDSRHPGPLLSFDLRPPQTPPGFERLAGAWLNATAEEKPAIEAEMVHAHLQAMDDQLSQLWHAAGAALALNRTLLLPQLTCFCVKNWYATDGCRLPGDNRTVFPFNCTIDQVFNPERLEAPGIDVAGVTLRVREPGFVRPQAAAGGQVLLPPGLVESLAMVVAGEEGAVDCSHAVGSGQGAGAGGPGSDGGTAGGDEADALSIAPAWVLGPQAAANAAEPHARRALAANVSDPQSPASPGALCAVKSALSPQQAADAVAAGVGANLGLPAPRHSVALSRRGLSGEELAAALAPHADTPWLHLTDPVAAFSGFTGPAAASAHQALMDAITWKWCCWSAAAAAASEYGAEGHLLRPRRSGGARDQCFVVQKDVRNTYFCSTDDPPYHGA